MACIVSALYRRPSGVYSHSIIVKLQACHACISCWRTGECRTLNLQVNTVSSAQRQDGVLSGINGIDKRLHSGGAMAGLGGAQASERGHCQRRGAAPAMDRLFPGQGSGCLPLPGRRWAIHASAEPKATLKSLKSILEKGLCLPASARPLAQSALPWAVKDCWS